jgi:hypothetical protein
MWPGEVEELTGDRNTGDLTSLKGREWDVCIDNPTTLPFWVRDAGQILKGKVGQYIFISTLSVHSSEAEVGADETAPVLEYRGTDPMKETQETLRANVGALYGPLKARSEKEAEVWFPGITTVIRPTLIVGPGDESDRFTYWPVRLDRGRRPPAGDGSDRNYRRRGGRMDGPHGRSSRLGVFPSRPGLRCNDGDADGVRADDRRGEAALGAGAFLQGRRSAWSDAGVGAVAPRMAGFARRATRRPLRRV